MRFEVSERLKTNKSNKEIILTVERQFKKISQSTFVSKNIVKVKGIEATFGSINRSDETKVRIKKIDGEFLCVADIVYKPSKMFWLFMFIGLFTWVFWLLPIVFYLTHKNSVKDAVKLCLEQIKNELHTSDSLISIAQARRAKENTAIDKLERYGELFQKGLITEEEYQLKKKELLRA